MTAHVKHIVMERLQYSESEIKIFEPELDSLEAEAAVIFEEWLRDNICSNVLYHGYSIDSLMHNMGMNFIAALLTLNWVIKDPETATEALKYGVQ